MKRKLRPFTFMGQEFRPCQWLESTSVGYRWYAVVYHPVGMEWAEQHSPRFGSKRQCQEWARDRERDRAFWESQPTIGEVLASQDHTSPTE